MRIAKTSDRRANIVLGVTHRIDGEGTVRCRACACGGGEPAKQSGHVCESGAPGCLDVKSGARKPWTENFAVFSCSHTIGKPCAHCGAYS